MVPSLSQCNDEEEEEAIFDLEKKNNFIILIFSLRQPILALINKHNFYKQNHSTIRPSADGANLSQCNDDDEEEAIFTRPVDWKYPGHLPRIITRPKVKIWFKTDFIYTWLSKIQIRTNNPDILTFILIKHFVLVAMYLLQLEECLLRDIFVFLYLF